jgi:lysophospholipase L1-like esterase
MRVLVFGASSAQGYWDSQGGWVDRLKFFYQNSQMRDFSKDIPKVMNLGVSDDTTAHILNRIGPEAKARENAKGVSFIIQAGSNNSAELDGQLRSSPEEYQADLTRLIETARQFSDKVLIVGFPAVDESRTCPLSWAPNMYFKNKNIRLFEDAAANKCEDMDVPFIPVHEKFQNSGEDLQAHDGLHPNDAGHQLIFELVRPELDKLLNI